ncbi:hypothetical protein MMC06_000504 [Schaereria dolodes]|nr:hypothetical protein [Schaereria dolodes]
MATAAVADSQQKDTRAREWDKAISEAKKELETIEHSQTRRLEALAITQSSRTEQTGDTYMDTFDCVGGQGKEFINAKVQESEGFPTTSMKNLSHDHARHILFNEQFTDLLREQSFQPLWDISPHTNPLSSKKARILELSVSKMVHQLLLDLSNREEEIERPNFPSQDYLSPFASSNISELRLKIAEINRQLSRLRKVRSTPEEIDAMRSPSFPRYTEDSVLENDSLESLNSTLSTILAVQQVRKPETKDLIARICYNLLVSNAPPNVHTYNILLSRLSDLNQLDLVPPVLESMRESRIRPNAITISTTLRFYTLTKNRSGFIQYINLMRAEGGGLTLAHPKTHITAANRDYLSVSWGGEAHYQRDVGSNFVLASGTITKHGLSRRLKIYEKVAINQDIFETLILGALKLFGISKAMVYYRDMVISGWNMSTELLVSILQTCCYEREWSLGYQLWEKLGEPNLEVNEEIYYWMLRLCLVCRQTKAFYTIKNKGIAKGVLPRTANWISHHVPIDKLRKTIIGARAASKRLDLERRIEGNGFAMYIVAKKISEIETQTYHGPSVAGFLAHRLKMSNRGGPADRRAQVRKAVEAANAQVELENCDQPIDDLVVAKKVAQPIQPTSIVLQDSQAPAIAPLYGLRKYSKNPTPRLSNLALLPKLSYLENAEQRMTIGA